MTAERPERRSDPAGKRKRRTPLEIRGRLLEAAREEFTVKGYAGATTAAISKRAEVAEIQMFRYFPSKAELFQEAVFAPLKEHFRSFNAEHMPEAVDAASIGERARLYMAELQAFLSDHAEMLVSLFVAQTYATAATDAAAAARADLQAFFEDAAAAMASRAPQPSDIDPGLIVRVAFGTVLGCITYSDWLFPDASGKQGAIGGAITEFVLAGIGPFSDVGAAGGKRPA